MTPFFDVWPKGHLARNEAFPAIIKEVLPDIRGILNEPERQRDSGTLSTGVALTGPLLPSNFFSDSLSYLIGGYIGTRPDVLEM